MQWSIFTVILAVLGPYIAAPILNSSSSAVTFCSERCSRAQIPGKTDQDAIQAKQVQTSRYPPIVSTYPRNFHRNPQDSPVTALTSPARISLTPGVVKGGSLKVIGPAAGLTIEAPVAPISPGTAPSNSSAPLGTVLKLPSPQGVSNHPQPPPSGRWLGSRFDSRRNMTVNESQIYE